MAKVELSSEELRRLVSILHNKVLGTSTEGRKRPSYQKNYDILIKLQNALVESNKEA